MKLRLLPFSLIVLTLFLPAFAGKDVYNAMGLKTKNVLAGTVLNAKVLPGADKQVVCIVTYFTGKKEESEAVNVRFAIFERDGKKLVEVFARDFGLENGGSIANGDLEVLDIDRDGIAEIVVSYDDFGDPLIELRTAEVILHDESGFHTGWTGAVEYDATRAARSIPVERRDRFVREIDFIETLRTRGITLFIEKTMIAVAGERLEPPKVVQETFPLRPYAGR